MPEKACHVLDRFIMSCACGSGIHVFLGAEGGTHRRLGAEMWETGGLTQAELQVVHAAAFTHPQIQTTPTHPTGQQPAGARAHRVLPPQAVLHVG